MTKIARYEPFTRPFTVDVVDDEIVVRSEQSPLALALTENCAALTGKRMSAAARSIRRKKASSKKTPA